MEETVFFKKEHRQSVKEQQRPAETQGIYKQERDRQEAWERQQLAQQKQQRGQEEENVTAKRSKVSQDMSVDSRMHKRKKKKTKEPQTVAGLSQKEIHGSFSEERRDAFLEVLREDCKACTFKNMTDDYSNTLNAVSVYSHLDLNSISYEDRSECLLKARNAVKQTIVAHEEKLKDAKGQQMELLQKELTVLKRYELYFNTFNTGHLQIPEDAVKRECTNMQLHKKGFSVESDGGPGWMQVGNRQLFDGEPCIQDVCQGGLGDCYLQAALASLVRNNPEYIKNCMTENPDGTVTVRLYRHAKPGEREAAPTAGGTGQAGPIQNSQPEMVAEYITVTKDIPAWSNGRTAYNNGPLWVHMIEKAYAASGFHFSDEDFKKRLTDQAKAQLFNELKRKPRDEEVLERVNVLFDKYKHSYNRIEGGNSDKFLEVLTGIKAERVYQHHITALNVGFLFDTMLSDPAAMKKVSFIMEPIMEPRDVDMILTELCSEIQRKQVKTYRLDNGTEKKYVTGALTIEDITEAINNMDQWEVKSAYLTLRFGIMAKFPELNDEEVGKVILNKLALLADWMENFFEKLDGNITIHHRMFATETDMAGNTVPKYTKQAQQCYEKIEKALKNKKYLNLGTRSFIPPGVNSAGLNGEAQSQGIVERHAYTIIGCEEYEGHKYIRIRNPWGTVERGYKKITIPGKNGGEPVTTYQGIEIREQKGQFRLELNDFMNRVGTIYGIS